jgi:hypothetical protein
MSHRRIDPEFKGTAVLVIVMVMIISVGLFWQSVLESKAERVLHNAYLGRLPKPTEPALTDPLQDMLKAKQEYRPMVITHIPEIVMGEAMPHPYVGQCINCHLITGGAEAGTQKKTVVGAMLERISENVVKLGPPITPQTLQPHPPAGRCIKCHDIVVQIPIRKKQYIWQ